MTFRRFQSDFAGRVGISDFAAGEREEFAVERHSATRVFEFQTHDFEFWAEAQKRRSVFSTDRGCLFEFQSIRV